MACWCARRSCDLISLPGMSNVLGLLVFLLCCFLLDCLYWKVGCIRRCLLGRALKGLTRRGLRGRRIYRYTYLCIYKYIYICIYKYICIYVYINIYTYIYIYMYIYYIFHIYIIHIIYVIYIFIIYTLYVI